MKRLDNKIAIITGGAQGIGFRTAERFAAEGATMSLWDVNAEKGAEAVAKLTATGATAEFRTVNVASNAEAHAAAKAVFEKFGRLDILINNAGITRDATLAKMTPEQWQQVMDVNLTGVFNVTQAVAPFMIEHKYGRIINASSIVGIHGNFGQSNYVAAKAGLLGMTKGWAKELGPKGITVNAVAPGFIETDMLAHIPEKFLFLVRETTPMRRFGTVDDVASAYVFLASDEAGFISGETLSVDGGLAF
jgi:3-oxoacyl-[acyl-carrier protein] reductase